MFNKLTITLAFITILAACDGSSSSSLKSPNRDDVPDGVKQCSQTDKSLVWFDFLQDNYLWNNELPFNIDAENYATSQAMLNDVKSTQDRFSFVLPSSDWNNISAGTSFGFGVRLDYAENDRYLRVVYVYQHSGAEQAGIARGDKILKIADIDASDIIASENNNDDQYNGIFGPDESGYILAVTIGKPNGEIIDTEMIKGDITTNSVMAVQTMSTNIGNVGYLSFQNGFITPSWAELDQAFSNLANEQINELILDLRYNGGGQIAVANRLATYIAGDKVKDQIFVQYDFNDNLANQNTIDYFNSSSDEYKPSNAIPYKDIFANALNLERLVVLTTAETCSASELVINGLRPYLQQVVVIGDDTCGKPVGMIPSEYCDETMLAINFQTVNADNFGDYFDGLAPYCSVKDETVYADWGSLNDKALATAIDYLETTTCDSATAANDLNAHHYNMPAHPPKPMVKLKRTY